MRIGIDLTAAIPTINGGWQYARNMLHALGEHATGYEFVVFANRQSAELVPQRPHFSTIATSGTAHSRMKRVLLQNVSPLPMRFRDRIDCLHHMWGSVPFMSHPHSVVTLMDVMAFDRPQDFSPWRRRYVQASRRHAVSTATVVAPISKTTAHALRDDLQVDDGRMVVIPPAIPSRFTPQSEQATMEFRRRYGLPQQFWLYIAQALPHKNHATLLAAHARRTASEPNAWPLVLCGDTPASLGAIVDAAPQHAAVTVLPRLTDAEMPLLYSAASALVYPTLFEGAGMPVMEALACGCPVVASDIPTTHEFAGDAALTFDPCDAESIERTMARCEHSPEVRERLRERGRVKIADYSPRVIADACGQAYDLVATLTRARR